MTRVIINGSKGRMGQALVACAQRHPELEVAGQIDVGDDLRKVIDQADAVIDFSFHQATPEVADLCAASQKALVIGTTGHSEEEKSRITRQAGGIPMVWATNYSTGVNTLFWLTRKAAEVLGPNFDLEVVEMHHRHKKDAPSGTARTLADILAEVRGWQAHRALRHGREGVIGERTDTEIGMHSLRGGDVVGDHQVIFAGAGERVEWVHLAGSRNTFANPALRAVEGVVGQKPGLYSMQDVLGLK
jgi:4-hydroxy-tetrahydrodipicolinate reductase